MNLQMHFKLVPYFVCVIDTVCFVTNFKNEFQAYNILLVYVLIDVKNISIGLVVEFLLLMIACIHMGL